MLTRQIEQTNPLSTQVLSKRRLIPDQRYGSKANQAALPSLPSAQIIQGTRIHEETICLGIKQGRPDIDRRDCLAVMHQRHFPMPFDGWLAIVSDAK